MSDPVTKCNAVAGQSKPAVAVVYPHLPHYRRSVFKALEESNRFTFRFYYSDNRAEPSIETHEDFRETQRLPLTRLGKLEFQFGLFAPILLNRHDYYLFLANPYIISTWLYALAAKVAGKPVLFWTHGWLGRDISFTSVTRHIFYRLADCLLLYGTRAFRIGLEKNYPRERMRVVFNSLDYEAQKAARLRVLKSTAAPVSGIYFAYVGRIVPEVRLDLAIEAIAIANEATQEDFPLVLVGDGSALTALTALARERSVRLICYGAIYNEEGIAPLLYGARAVIAPGKVGLTAMHALAYGVPVITHADFETQMPEHEAIIPDCTGDFFERGDARALAKLLVKWSRRPRTTVERELAISTIEANYTPKRQVEEICEALEKVSAMTARV